MIPKIIPILTLAALLTVSQGACQKPTQSMDQPFLKGDQSFQLLKLKPGMRIVLTHRILNRDSADFGKIGNRTLTIENPSGAEGINFQWSSSPQGALDDPGPPTTASPLPGEDPARSSQVAIHFIDFSNTFEGKMALPNILNARRMTPPTFWPSGDLYLSNSSGIWLSDIAFEELKKNRKTEWQAGLLQNPILGPAQGISSLESNLEKLSQNLSQNPEGLAKALQIHKKRGTQKYPLKIDGKEREVEVLEAENWLAAYKILNHAQNPLILEITLAPNASPADILFSPLSLIKGLVDYRVMEILSPRPSSGGKLIIQGS